MWLILAMLVGALLLTLPIDGILRQIVWRNHDAVEIVNIHPSLVSDTLIVYLPGILASSDMMPEKITRAWAERGEVWGVNYLSPRFRPEKIAEGVANRIALHSDRHKSLSRVVLIGSSMGGLLTYDIRRQVASYLLMSNNALTPLIPIDAPTCRKDLQSPWDWLVRGFLLVPFGPIWNPLSKLIMKKVFIPPKEENIEPDVDPEWLEWYITKARSFPLSFWRDQAMYIMKHGRPERGSIDDVVVYIRSTNDDDTVREEALDPWIEAVSASTSGGILTVQAKGAHHAAYAESPGPYEEAFPVAFGYLGIYPTTQQL